MMEQQRLNFSETEQKKIEEELLQNKLTPDRMRLAFFALMNAAMQYREMFFRDDIEAEKAKPAPSVDRFITGSSRSITTKTVRNAHRDNLAAFEKRILFFNKKVYEEIEATQKGMSAQTREHVDNITGYFVACAEEMIAARNQHEVLGLLKSYNHGDLDFLFEASRKEQQQKYINEENIQGPPVADQQNNS